MQEKWIWPNWQSCILIWKCKQLPEPLKCKLVLLGAWKNWTKKEVPLNYLTISEFLDILGVKLFANFNQTRNVNGEILIKKVSDLINAWKPGKFMPLTDPPNCINTFALSKIWYRLASINIKYSDIDKIESKIKSWLNQDSFEKP